MPSTAPSAIGCEEFSLKKDGHERICDLRITIYDLRSDWSGKRPCLPAEGELQPNWPPAYAGGSDFAAWLTFTAVLRYHYRTKLMYCRHCGTDNADDAIYCKRCGGLMEPEDETRVAVKERTAVATDFRSDERLADRPGADDDESETRLFSITPTVKFVMLGYVAAVIGAFILVALMSLFLPVIGPLPAVVIGLGLLLIPAFYHIRKKLVRYTLMETTIEIDRGLISRTTQNIPLRRVQDVTVTAGFLQRILGYGDIEIENASETNSKIILDDIDSPKKYAEMILKQMRRLEK